MTYRRASLVMAATIMFASLAGPAMAMSAYKWKNRPLVVFAASEGDPALARQRSIVSAVRPAFQDRAIVVVYVIGDKVSTDMGPGPAIGADELRKRFGVGRAAFRVLLVGKDGGVKLSSEAPIAASTLFSTIDAMPMRRQEAKGR